MYGSVTLQLALSITYLELPLLLKLFVVIATERLTEELSQLPCLSEWWFPSIMQEMGRARSGDSVY